MNNRTMCIVEGFPTNESVLEITGELAAIEVKRYAIKRNYHGRPMELDDLEEVFSQNLSSEYTKLIQSAGRWCERFASDILIDISVIEKELRDPLEFLNGQTENRKSHLFGFRSDGVDHREFIESQIKSKGLGAYDYYRAVYELEIHMFIDDDGRYLTVEVGFERIH